MQHKPAGYPVSPCHRDPTLKISGARWELLHEGVHKESWNSASLIALDRPLVLEPGQTRAIYIHSNTRGDRGIRYQGFWSSKSVVRPAAPQTAF